MLLYDYLSHEATSIIERENDYKNEHPDELCEYIYTKFTISYWHVQNVHENQ